MITIEPRNVPQSDAVLPSAPLSARASMKSTRNVSDEEPRAERHESIEREERWNDLPCTD